MASWRMSPLRQMLIGKRWWLEYQQWCLAVLHFSVLPQLFWNGSVGINSEYRDDDEKLVLTVARQMRLPLQIETVFVGSSSRGTFVAAPHLDHEAPDLDVGIQLEPGEVNPDELLEALLSDTRSLLIPALNRGYIAGDEGQSADSVEHSTPSHDNVHNVLANVDLWESERGRFGIKADMVHVSTFVTFHWSNPISACWWRKSSTTFALGRAYTQLGAQQSTAVLS